MKQILQTAFAATAATSAQISHGGQPIALPPPDPAALAVVLTAESDVPVWIAFRALLPDASPEHHGAIKLLPNVPTLLTDDMAITAATAAMLYATCYPPHPAVLTIERGTTAPLRIFA